ncbi:MAG: SDR family oxidoreductase [Alphaproteobacteria bacterium]|nr:SDR family oxidoreductase [Alphaproteobacteria bacterium]
MLEDLKDRNVLITGSSIGIGAAVAREMGRLGARVAVHGNRNLIAAQKVVEDIERSGGFSALISGDVSKPDSAARIVADAASALGGIDILINNAGSLIRRLSNEDFDNALYDQVFDLNVRSIYTITQAALPHLKKRGGAIINSGSIAGRNGGAMGSSVYSAAKAAVHSISRNMAREFAPFGIRVNTVAPGFIDTDFHAITSEEGRQAAQNATALKRLGTVEDCLGAYVFLASDSMSGYITGQIIDVNGGQMMP